MLKKWKLLLKIVVSVIVLVFVVNQFEITSAVFTFGELHWWWGGVLSLSITFQVSLQTLRWKTLYGAKESPPLGEFLRFILVGYFFSVMLPFSLAGDAVKAVALGKRNNGVLRSSAAILYGRFLGVTALFTLFLISYALFDFPLQQPVPLLLFLITMGLFSVVAILLFSPSHIIAFISKSRFIKRFSNHIEVIFMIPRRDLLWGGLYSFGIQLAVLVTFYSAFRMVGADITAPLVFFYVPLTALLLFLPITFWGLGIREGSLSYFLSPVDGITSAQCIQVSMLNYGALLILAVIGGAVLLLNRQKTTT